MISSQLTLWDQAGSQVIRGNLLVVPIADSVMYFEPLYLQASAEPHPRADPGHRGLRRQGGHGAHLSATRSSKIFGERVGTGSTTTTTGGTTTTTGTTHDHAPSARPPRR